MYWRGTILLKQLRPSFQNQKLSTVRSLRAKLNQSNKVDPKLLAKFKCHPTIPCGIPLFPEDLDAAWYHIPDNLLPINWSSDWLNFRYYYNFLPDMSDTYCMGPLDITFKALIGIPYPIKGVMYCTVDRVEPGGLYDQKLIGNPEGFVFQDAIGDYYYFYEFSQGGDEYLAKFRAPRGATVIDFVKHYFRGAVKFVDMDLVWPEPEAHCVRCYHRLEREQEDLAALQRQAASESCCACRTVRGLPNYHFDIHWGPVVE